MSIVPWRVFEVIQEGGLVGGMKFVQYGIFDRNRNVISRIFLTTKYKYISCTIRQRLLFSNYLLKAGCGVGKLRIIISGL